MQKKNKSRTEKKYQFVIFMYSIAHLAKKDKIRFYYAIKGRDGKSGIIKELNIEQLGRAVLFVPIRFEKELEQFMHHWKCKFSTKKVSLLDEE